ncbi:GNAT family N-acetyltransferase [Catellatospora vulcania]|uniref:GNAT family N-acetyltransferase n=1 Tax=Catellatospora vulcania TaxID=1460450 RepID=UPI0012D46ACA|nr:GNAT family N-acetyltransferase [Catellatospora vulcania]
MIETRRAVAGDAAELVRLRAVMLSAMAGQPVEPGPWQQEALALLQTRLGEPEPVMAAYVVDVPGGAGLAACAVGTIDVRLGGPANPSGRTGYVYNVVTDVAYRRRGYSRACMEALLGWFAERGVTTVDLRATGDGEPLYRSLGFAPVSYTALRLAAGRR